MPRLNAPRYATCHYDKPHYSLGLCVACYFRHWRAVTKARAITRARLAAMKAAA